MKDSTPEELALEAAEQAREAAAVRAFEVLNEERSALLERLADLDERIRRIRPSLPPSMRGDAREMVPPPEALDADERFALDQLRSNPKGLRPVEIAELAAAQGFGSIAHAKNPRLSAVAALRALEKRRLVYRGKYGRFRYRQTPGD